MTIKSGQLRRFAEVRNGGTPASSNAGYWDGDIEWATPDDLGKLCSSKINDTKRRITELAVRENSLPLLPLGSLLISTRAPIGHMGLTTSPMSFNQGCRGIVPKAVLSASYLYYVFSSKRVELSAIANGTTFSELSRNDLASVDIDVPPLPIQHRIVQFLDQKTAQIDTLIEKKRTLLERLAEKRQALITRAVTKGLDPGAPMKDSGVDWLGTIPSRWSSGNLRRFATMKTGHTPTRTVGKYWENCSIPWFTLADVWQLRDGRRKYLEETAEKISELGLSKSAAELLPTGTVVFSRTASIGFSGIMPCPMATSQDFWNWICGPRMIPDYLLLLFRCMRQKFDQITSGSTHKTIYQPIAAGLEVCVPPPDEQKAIVRYVESKIGPIDEVTDLVNTSIDLLAEYRTALITAAVTGQIPDLL